MNPRAMHDEACYHMLRLRHVAKFSNDELEREYAQMCATAWACDPFRDEDHIEDDLRRIRQFCNVKV